MEITLTRPLPDGVGYISQWFGEHPEWYEKFGQVGHTGIDYAAPFGTPVLAAHNGIIYTGNDPDGYGLYVIVRGSKFQTLYAHLSSIEVTPKQEVVARQIIGRLGSTGNSTGNHLHFGLKVLSMRNPKYGNYIDPVPFRG